MNVLPMYHHLTFRFTEIFSYQSDRRFISGAGRIKLFFSIMIVFAGVSPALGQIWDGGGDGTSWDDPLNWNNNAIPTSIDDITIDCSCTVYTNRNIVIDGSLAIATGTTLNLNGKTLDVGSGDITASVYNYGTITNSNEIKVKGNEVAGNGPYFYNYALISDITKLSVGNNNGGGLVVNYSTGVFNIVDAHIDGTLENYGAITLTGEFLLHGGVLNGNGSVIAEDIRIDDNGGGGAAGSGNLGEVNGGSFEYTGGCSDGGNNPNNLFKVNGTTYTFNELVDAIDNGSISNLVLSPQVISCDEAAYVILPIELLSFELTVEKGAVNIAWVTASELNNEYFTIERSLDGMSWETISKVPGAGTSNSLIKYEITDYPGIITILYYRILQTDYDGQREYFAPKAVNINGEVPLVVYPNPTANYLKIYPPNTNQYQISVTDYLGKKMPDFSVLKTDSELKLDLSDLPKGIYFINISGRKFKVIKH